jgi:hypothetical protein
MPIFLVERCRSPLPCAASDGVDTSMRPSSQRAVADARVEAIDPQGDPQ